MAGLDLAIQVYLLEVSAVLADAEFSSSKRLMVAARVWAKILAERGVMQTDAWGRILLVPLLSSIAAPVLGCCPNLRPSVLIRVRRRCGILSIAAVLQREERSYEKTRDGFGGSVARAGSNGIAGRRARRNRKHSCAQERIPDRQRDVMSRIYWRLWLCPGLDQCVSRPLLPLRSLLISSELANSDNRI